MWRVKLVGDFHINTVRNFCSAFHNLRLGSYKSKNRWATVGNTFCKHLSSLLAQIEYLAMYSRAKNVQFYAPKTKNFQGSNKALRISSRQLIPIFDKPAFSRFSQLFQPRIVVHNFGKIVKRPVVCHSSPFVGQSPFRTFRQIFQPASSVASKKLRDFAPTT